MTSGRKELPLEEKFWPHVKKTKGCWIWTGCFMSSGYGQTSYKGKNIGAHRASVILSGRDIPKGKHVMHICDNKRCVNPLHLRVVDQFENYQDYARKKVIRDIGSDLNNPNIKNAQLVKKYGPCIGTLRRIAGDRGWCKDRQRAAILAETARNRKERRNAKL